MNATGIHSKHVFEAEVWDHMTALDSNSNVIFSHSFTDTITTAIAQCHKHLDVNERQV